MAYIVIVKVFAQMGGQEGFLEDRKIPGQTEWEERHLLGSKQISPGSRRGGDGRVRGARNYVKLSEFVILCERRVRSPASGERDMSTTPGTRPCQGDVFSSTDAPKIAFDL